MPATPLRHGPATSSPGPIGALHPDRSRWSRIGVAARHAVLCSPELLALGVAGFSVAPLLLLLLGHFSAALVLPLGGLGAAVALATFRPSEGSTSRRDVLLSLAAIAVVLVWLLLNLAYSSQDIFAIRDPATYNLAARWLMDHHSLIIDGHAGLFGSSTTTDATSAGFGGGGAPGDLYAQGNHLLPALLACFGWTFGSGAILKGNLVLAALALIVFFGLARRILGAGYALLALIALACSLPLLYVSRDSFTEPLALLFLLGGVMLLDHALHRGRLVDFGAAGFVTGMSAAVRIDSYASVLALIVSAALLLGAAAPEQRRAVARQVAVLLSSGAISLFLGWSDVTRLSPGYYHDQRSHIVSLVYAAVALLVLVPIAAVLSWRSDVARVLRSDRFRGRAAVVAGGAVVIVAVILWSRPYWMTTHGPANASVAALQSQQGVSGDGSELYNELTVHWLAYYVGWPILILGAGGYVVLIRRALRPRGLSVAPVLMMGLSVSALYLWTSQITPDQPWASRRYVPVVLPVLMIAAVAAVQWLAPRVRAWAPVATLGGAIVLIGLPLATSIPAFTVREEVPQLGQVVRLCAALGDHAAVVTLDDASRVGYGQTLRSYCGADTVGINQASAATLAQVNASVTAAGRTLFLMAATPGAFPAIDQGQLTPLSSIEMLRWPSLINKVPRQSSNPTTVTIYLTGVDHDGHPVALSPH